MADGTDPRHGYVRFYLNTVTQLDAVREALMRNAVELRSSVEPYGEVLAVSEDTELAPVRGTMALLADSSALWRPRDPVNLTGIVDVYDVVGHFTFQGDDDGNLDRLGKLVVSYAEELDRQRKCLAALAKLPARATQTAEGLSREELQALEKARAEKLAPFEPVAATLREQCSKVLAALRGVTKPDLSELANAETSYQEYVRKIQVLYAKSLPFLRRSLEELCRVAQVDVPANWPEQVPFAPALPAELVTPPPTDTPTTTELRARMEQLDNAERSLQTRGDELVQTLKRLEADRAALTKEDNDAASESLVAKAIVRWASRLEDLDAVLRGLEGLGQQRQSRIALLGNLYGQISQLQSTLTTLKSELEQREKELAEALSAHNKEKENEPALFGKEEWRKRVAELAESVEARKNTLEQRRAGEARARVDLAALQARSQAEQTEINLIEKALQEAKERELAVRKEIAEIAAQIGTALPATRLSLAQAEEFFNAIGARRAELRQRLTELDARVRRAKEEQEYGASQFKQVGLERNKLREQMGEAQRAAATAHQDALRQLADKRRLGFDQYAQQVMAPLEDSLSQVDRIFIDPARQVLLQRAEPGSHKAGSLRAQAEGLAQAVAQLAPRAEPLLTQQAGVLERIQLEFVGRVRDAVRSAW